MKRILLIGPFLAVLAILCLTRQAVALDNAPAAEANALCIACHGQPSASMELGGEKLSLFVAQKTLDQSIHSGLACTSCHRSEAVIPHAPSQANSVRGYRVAENQACGNCHLKQFYRATDAAHASNKGDAPVCSDCHGAHSVQVTDSTGFRHDSVAVCTGCHQDQSLMQKYGVNTRVAQTYMQDFHGKTESLLKLEGPAAEVHEAVCTDCHGSHDILKPGTAAWVAANGNQSQMCQKCHDGATGSFSAAFLAHTEPSLSKAPLVFLSRLFYWFMIPFVGIGLIIHVALDIRTSRREEA